MNKDEIKNISSLGSNSAAGCYPKSLSKGVIRMIAVANVNGYEIINEFIPDDLPGRYNSWYLLDGNRQVSIKKKNGKFSHYPNFKSRDEAESFAWSLPQATG